MGGGAMTLSKCVIARTEQVLRTCFKMLGLGWGYVPFLICDASNYWSGLLLTLEYELPHVKAELPQSTVAEAQALIKAGSISEDSTLEEQRAFARTVLERITLATLDRYGDSLRDRIMSEEDCAEHYIDEDDFEDEAHT
jgi:hypothetical protein